MREGHKKRGQREPFHSLVHSPMPTVAVLGQAEAVHCLELHPGLSKYWKHCLQLHRMKLDQKLRRQHVKQVVQNGKQCRKEVAKC